MSFGLIEESRSELASSLDHDQEILNLKPTSSVTLFHFMQHSSKLSKTRSWTPSSAVNSGSNQSAHHDNSYPTQTVRREARTSVGSSGRKPGFFAQLFSPKAAAAIIESPVGSSFVNLSRKASSPSVEHHIPPNLAIRSLSPDLLNDPAFSTNPLSHPLFVTNPDSYTVPPPSKPILNGNSHADMTESHTQESRFALPYYGISGNDSISLTHPNSYSQPLDPSSLEGMGTNTSTSQSSTIIDEPSPPSSLTDTTTSSISSGVAGKLPKKKNLIILEPPRILSPPPAYDEPSHQRPATVRHTSVPSLPSSQPYPTEVPPRPATTANDSRYVDLRRNHTDTNPRGLDPIDELDESNPLGLSLHHGGPYEAIKKVTQTPREPQNSYNKSIPQQAAHVSTQKTSSKQPFIPAARPFVPFGASLNLTPGQILPRNYQPYSQLPLRIPNHLTPYPQRNNPDFSVHQVLHPQPAMQNQQIPNPQKHTPQQLMQAPLHHPLHHSQHHHQAQPPVGREQPYAQQNTSQFSTQHPSQLGVCVRADLFDAEPAQPPSPLWSVPQRFEDDASSIYGDEADAYDGIEDEEISQVLDNPTPEILHEPESSTHLKSAPDMPQTYIDNATAIEDNVARALYSGFSAFNEGPSISDGREAFSRSVPIPILPPGASYRPPPRRYEQQGRPLEYPEEQTSYTPYVTANQSDGVWHRRATSLDPDHNLQGSQLPQHRPMNPGHPHVSVTQNLARVPELNPDIMVQLHAAKPYQQPQQSAPLPPNRNLERPVRSKPAPSMQQSISSTNSRNGLPPRHVPAKLTMPQPLYNPNAPLTHRDIAVPSNKPQVRFQPPTHNSGVSLSVPLSQTRPSTRNSAPESSKVQAQIIPMAVDSRKVLRKRSSVQAVGPGTASVMPVGTARSNYLPTRSKSEMRPPTTGNRTNSISVPPDKKAPRRLLSKKRAEF
ncbi:hypothetical protein EV368DRAFT_64565 [Lentinula lateritia]|nr:hypothetical protein EV368DRAFT_64565 [Lentinula lateritia]